MGFADGLCSHELHLELDGVGVNMLLGDAQGVCNGVDDGPEAAGDQEHARAPALQQPHQLRDACMQC